MFWLQLLGLTHYSVYMADKKTPLLLVDPPMELGKFEKYLTIWVFLCMAIGIGFEKWMPATVKALGSLSVNEINLPVAILIWLMIIPMLIRIDLSEIYHVKTHWRGILITLGVNWIVKPFSMAFLGWIFLKHVFAAYLPSGEIDHYIAGLIILSAAPCTAMVFVWSYLAGGAPHFTLTQVALNDLLMIVLFAPIVGLLLGITNLTVPWATLLWSVLIYILVPFVIGQAIRWVAGHTLQKILKWFHPVSLVALLAMLVLLFAFQGDQILASPWVVLFIAIPIVIQVYFNSMLAYGLNYWSGESFAAACPSALIGASNFFELAVATAVSLYGFNSGATLATVVGVLVEVPVMLSVVSILKRTKGRYCS
jgi:ACR3 family arsenite transporter